MADMFVLEELRAYLIAQGVGVAPTAKDAAATTLPPIWLQPRGGAPQPRFSDANGGYQETAAITLIDTAVGGPTGELEAWEEETIIDVIVRSLTAAPGKLLHRQIRGLLHPIGDNRGRQLWLMNNLLVQYSGVWRPEQPTGATDIDFARTASYRFMVRRKSLAGQNYAP